jgi:hypothetical protein
MTMRGSLSAEINEMAHELVEFGKRCADAGRDWLSDRRNEMNRDPQDRTNPGRGQYSDQNWRGREEDQQQRYYGGSQGSPRGYAGNRETSAQERYRPQRGYSAESAPESYLDQDYRDEGYRAGQYGPRSGYEMGYGGPGGYGPQSQSQSQSTFQKDFERNFGDEYRQETYGPYGRSEPYRSQPRGMQNWGDRSMQDESQAQRLYGSSSRDTQGESRLQYGPAYGSGYGSTFDRGDRLQGFRGRGPKNYTRSDERIRDDLCERLSDADDIDASGLSVTVMQGVVTLDGEVPHRRMKHWAEDLAESCSGVRDVDNKLRVRSRDEQSNQVSATGEQRSQGQTYGQSQKSTTSRSEDTSRH